MASSLHIILLLCVHAAASAVPRDNCGSCPSGWTQSGDRCYMFQNVAMDWAAAERHCNFLGGNLASIQPNGGYEFLRSLIHAATGGNQRSWIGGHDGVKEGVWFWSDGSNFQFNRWGKGQPDNWKGYEKGGEHCMEMNHGGIDVVNDQSCSWKNPFVCVKPL